jgi:hypothetical protein
VPEGEEEDGPSLSEQQKKKKKRKGELAFHVELVHRAPSPSKLTPTLTFSPVLAHEKLFLGKCARPYRSGRGLTLATHSTRETICPRPTDTTSRSCTETS